MINGVPSVAVTGLQRNVIVMAFCCKKGGTSDFRDDSGTAKATQHIVTTGTTGITVLRRDWVVVPDSNRR